MNLDILVQIREIYAQATPDKLRTLIARHFIPTQAERKQHAEIPTPVELVDQMLDKIPPEFWNEPHRVFEPCCGKGNFVVAIFDKFYQGLSTAIPDAELRCQKIITECLYYADISALNVWITTQILQCHTTSKCGRNVKLQYNSHVGDTLELNVGTKCGSVVNVQDDVVCQHIVRKKNCGRTNCVIKTHIANKPTTLTLPFFDAVIGNPPYQNSSRIDIRKGGYGGRSLWDKFVLHGLNQLNASGYLVMVHPPSWRKPEHYMWPIITQNQIVYLNMISEKQSIKLFGASTKVDWYVVQKCIPTKSTRIHDELNLECDIDIRLWKWLPGAKLNLIQKLFDFTGKYATFDVIYSRSAYGTDKKWVSKNTIKHQYPDNDFRGKYGMSQITYGLPITSKKEGDMIIAAINKPEFRDIIQTTKWSSFQTDWRMWNSLRCDFYKLF